MLSFVKQLFVMVKNILFPTPVMLKVACFETFEQRRHLSATIDQFGTLRFEGTSGADIMNAEIQGDKIKLELNGANDGVFHNVKRLHVNGAAGNDTITVTAKEAGKGRSGNVLDEIRIIGDEGDDVLNAENAFASVTGPGTGVIMMGGSGNDVLVGSSRNDMLFGNFGDDVILAGDGNDDITPGPGNNVVFGEAGDDTLNNADSRNIDQLGLIETGGNNLYDGGKGYDKYIFRFNSTLHVTADPGIQYFVPGTVEEFTNTDVGGGIGVFGGTDVF
jgi:Ca2+-binding RTX toxin-like protein